MTYSVVKPDRFGWITRPHAEGEPARHVAELSEVAGFAEVRANVWRYEPRREDVPTGGLITVRPRTPLQSVNHGESDLLVYAYGFPPESENAELLPSAV